MTIYGTAILAACVFAGLLAGRLFGVALGVEANVGGVGIAMLMLIVMTDALRGRGLMTEATDGGILFWGSIYVPVVVAMAACQNVRGAISGGPTAVLAGTIVVLIGFALVPVLAGKPTTENSDSEAAS